MKKFNEDTLWIIGTFAGFALILCLPLLAAMQSHAYSQVNANFNNNIETHAHVQNKQANFEFVLDCDKNSKCKIYTEEIR